MIPAKVAREVLSLLPYKIKYIFGPEYCPRQGGDLTGNSIGIGYMSTHYRKYRDKKSEPVKINDNDLEFLLQKDLSNVYFHKKIRQLFGM